MHKYFICWILARALFEEEKTIKDIFVFTKMLAYELHKKN